MNETLSTVDGRNVLRMERRLAHPPEKVWRAITEPGHLSQWYPFDVVEMDLRVGGKILFDDKHGTVMDAVITELDPPRIFAFSEHAPASMFREIDDLVHLELRPEAAGCLLIFTHVFDDRAAAASYASGWQVCLDVLEMVVDGKPVQLPGDDMAELHHAYIERFGLAEGTAEKTADGWQVRFERQLTKPIDEVWALLDGSAATVGAPAPQPFVDGRAHGVVTAVEAPTSLEFEDGGRVRWELSRGTGHGARLVVVETGLADPDAALASWRAHIERLATRLLA
jgi:uncharacterized protein YndB with AHSA1/START domain